MILAVTVGLALTSAAFLYARQANRERLESRFERETASLTHVAAQRIDSHLDVLYSLRDFFNAEGTVSRQAFTVFAAGQRLRHTGIQALEWVPEVKEAERGRFEASAREAGLAGFRLTDRDAEGRLVPAARRTLHYPIYYVEPYAGNERALGYAPVLAQRDLAIAKARDTASPVASEGLTTVQAADPHVGIAVFVPVYRGVTPPATVEGRRQALIGLVEGLFLVGDMLKVPLAEANSTGMAVTLEDVTDPAATRLLFTDAGAAGGALDERLSRRVPVEVAGRQWRLTFQLANASALERFAGQEWLVLLIGLFATGLLGGYLSRVVNQRLQVERMVIERTRALNHEKELAQRYLDVAAVVMVMMTPDGTVTLINRQGSEVLGYPQEAIIGRNWYETFVPAWAREHARKRYARLVKEACGAPHFFEGPILTADGQERLIAWNSTAICDEAGRPLSLLSSGADVTDYKRAIEEVAVRSAELKQAQEIDRLKNNFSSAVSHDLRTPLTSIMGYAEFLEDDIGGTLSPEQHGYVVQIMRGAKRLEHLVDDLLDFARLDAGTFQLRREASDLGIKLHEVVESLGPQIGEAGLALELDAPVGELEAHMDASRIERVLFNLLHNAIKFTPSGGTITVRAWREAGMVRCEVIDTGIGIAEDQLFKLFQRFSQLKSGSEKGGTGLGLSICRAIVDAHGGTIGVRSQPGQGSTFWFALPVAHEGSGTEADSTPDSPG